ncbi:hypothetical protein [Roseisolibacter sp. H3M3-2]|uniref:hypothetical protein n=1 Tax=Roseisolibacter sp. H3M3-2 TaxID=3031323 RepID=UPI0023DC1F37|nr:hypothetical protein [Roseisolibacter sp. H3M3-2]MDF1503513.1 hypothetical protein [Roseisolibacter sp. H3M3-2]
MVTILIEGVLFAAFVAVAVALVAYGVFGHTPLGLWARQTANRRRIDRAQDLRCAIHGDLEERDLVRLPTGERICPHCYAETLDGIV